MPLESNEFIEFMEEQSAAINTQQDEFLVKYGFTHDCRCDLDYKEGNVGLVPKCWVSMCEDALETLVLHRALLATIASDLLDDPAQAAMDFLA